MSQLLNMAARAGVLTAPGVVGPVGRDFLTERSPTGERGSVGLMIAEGAMMPFLVVCLRVLGFRGQSVLDIHSRGVGEERA